MHLSGLVLLVFAAFVAATPVPDVNGAENSDATLTADLANCGPINGNCYENDCGGNPTTLVCLGGSSVGCQCGFNCNGKGPCSDNNCRGVNGRCTAEYLGCSCY